LHENPWGLKSLAYPIAKKTTGLYLVVEYVAPSTFNEKLKIQLLRDESVLRHMFTRLDKYAVDYNNRKRSGVQHFQGTEKNGGLIMAKANEIKYLTAINNRETSKEVLPLQEDGH